MRRAGVCFRGAEYREGVRKELSHGLCACLVWGSWRYGGTSSSSGRYSVLWGKELCKEMTLGCICKERRHLRKGKFFLKKVSEFHIPLWGAPGVAILIFPALSIILQSPHSWLQWLYAFYFSQHWSLPNKEISMLTYVFLREEGPRGAPVWTPSKENCFFRSQALAWGKLIFTEFSLDGKG